MLVPPATGVTEAESMYRSVREVEATSPSNERRPLMRAGATTGPTVGTSQSTNCWVLALTSGANARESAQMFRRGAGSG
jgi:hypothetical protein